MDFRKWIVIDTADCDAVNWRDPYMVTTNARTAMKSVDGSKTLVSYNEVMPNSLNAIASKGAVLDRAAIEALLATPEWFVEVEEV